MTVILQEWSKAEKYTVQDGDTLASIVTAKCPDLDWKTLARYNWGTDLPREVIRAMAENIGVKVTDIKPELLATPEKIRMEPDTDLPADSKKLKIPKAWKKDSVEVEKTHVIKVRRHTPPTAISIRKLDKWFIPDEEECQIEYGLEGQGDFATKLQLDVYGNNYCDCTNWSNGLGTYGSALEDVPVFARDLVKQAQERMDYELLGDKWKGEVTATKGLLSRKTGSAKKRFINVAFSPYTVHFRYWKADGDKNARLLLQPFWPQFKETKTELTDADVNHAGVKKVVWSNAAKADRGVIIIKDKNGQRVHQEVIPDAKLAAGNQELPWDGSYHPDAMNSKFGTVYDNADGPYAATITTFVREPKNDSLKIKWKIKNTSKLDQGLLQITDGSGKLVFQKPLPKGKCGQGEQEFQWDGKYAKDVKNSANGDAIIPQDMPYRVQLQAHTAMDKPEGLALAAMHTEVRLYVHPQTAVPKDLAYDAWKAKASMPLSLGPLVPGDPPKKAGSTEWFQYKLAEYGFSPGPANGKKHEAYKQALLEFKRSVPQRKKGADYQRLKIDDKEDGVTRKAVEHIEARYKRNPYGDPAQVIANSNTPDLSEADVKSRLPDPSKEIILWADDRQYYTSGDPAKDDSNNSYWKPPFNLNDYRGGMSNADGKTDLDTAAIPRPWLPLQAGLQLLSRTKELKDEVALVTDEALLKKMHACIGPLRVDWTFDELSPDISTVDTAHANYHTDFVRSRSYLAWAVDNNKATHTRKDTDRQAVYRNCPENLGGIRPGGLASYYEKAFGFGDLSPSPWRATNVSDTESIATVVHDHIASGQKDKTSLFEKLIGTAGAYFTSSRIAGDGYRVRAEVVMKKFAGYEFPNLTTLEARYPTLPQAHTARLRVWRRSSFRGYVCWGPATGNWGSAFIDEFRNHYRAAHVYFVHESNNAPNSYNITDVFDPAINAHETRYKKLVRNNVTRADLKDMTKMALRSDSLWPWSNQRNFGWEDPSPVDLAQNQLFSNWLNGVVFNETWRKFRAALLTALLREVEKKGVMRGHLMVEFDASPAFFIESYLCNRGGGQPQHTYWYIENSTGAGGRKNGSTCPAPGCFSDHPTNTVRSVLNSTGVQSQYANGMPLPAVGGGLGATWLFWRGENTNRLKVVWVHEVGHHRHMEHSANAPGAAASLHDSENNTKFAGWAGVGGGGVAAATQWDRRCIMSYSDAWYGELGYLCGRCLLRNRGWKITGLGFPGPNKGEP